MLAGEPRLLRYDLRPGDRLLYRQTLERETSGKQLEALSRGSWTNHLLVLDGNSGSLVLGFQRNRASGELLRLKVNGQDRLKQGRKDLAERVARNPRHAEGNRFDSAGWPQMHPQVVRESNSKVLIEVREIMPLPQGAVRTGDRWEVPGLVPMTFTAAAWETLKDESCLRVTGTSPVAELNLSYWFCPASGVMQRLEAEVVYPAMSGGATREKFSLELLERGRGQPAAGWLADADSRHGALAALLVSDTLPVATSDLYSLLEQPDADAHRRVLGLAYRRRLPSPGVERLASLLGSASPRVRALAVRMLEQHNPQQARPLIERALADSDELVQRAALN
ncbi:MAG: HEAT repeat domain-containing protein, partial [Nevskiales bacterium]